MINNKIKTITILGASSDIGFNATRKFLELGYNVNAHFFNNGKNLKKIKLNYKKNLTIFRFDLKKIYLWEKYIKKKSFLKKTDVLISLTGYLNQTKFENFNLDRVYNHLNINYFSSLILTKHIIPHMIKKKFGRIIYSSSIGTKFGGSDESFAYSLSKFCNEFFPKKLKNLTEKNIIANTLKIGVTDTKIHKKLGNKNLKKRVKLIPIKRMATISEVVDVIINLALNNHLISNEIINISGGE